MNQSETNAIPPIATFYRGETNPKSAPFALFLATDDVNIETLCHFQQQIGAKSLIAICLYQQYFDCLAYANNVIFCHENDLKPLIAWLENPMQGFIYINTDNFETGFKEHKFCYFSHLYTTKDKLASHLEIYLQRQVADYLPKTQKHFLLVQIDSGENFELENYSKIMEIINKIFDIGNANIFYSVNFSMSHDDYRIHILTA